VACKIKNLLNYVYKTEIIVYAFMKIGIVGKPNTGKSTFFKAATLADVQVANYPFTTIDANVGTGFVRVECAEKFFGVKCNPRQGYCIDGNRFVPVELVDVAGLVIGAHEGRGLGNKFLDDLRQADVLIHIVDASGKTDEEGRPCEDHDPLNDIKFLEDELNSWYYGILERNRKKIQTINDIATQVSGLNVSLSMVKETVLSMKLNENPKKWSEAELMGFVKILREKSKPILIAANKCDHPQSEKYLERLKELGAIPCSAETELALREANKKGLIKYIPGDKSFEILSKDLTDGQKRGLEFIKKFLERFGNTGVQQVINQAVFKVLNYIVVFPGGVNKLADSEGRILPDAFLMPPGSTALDFAYKIHTDFGDKFIAAIDVKTKQRVGKDYKLKNMDVIEIISGR